VEYVFGWRVCEIDISVRGAVDGIAPNEVVKWLRRILEVRPKRLRDVLGEISRFCGQDALKQRHESSE
jgi:ferric-dicitrate binding protein FerR (iron transport regulator)